MLKEYICTKDNHGCAGYSDGKCITFENCMYKEEKKMDYAERRANMNKHIIIGTDKQNDKMLGGICPWKNANISENDSFYSLNNETIDTKLYIYKDSDEGRDLQAWLDNEDNRNNHSINKKALELISSQLQPSEITEIYDIKEEEGYARGYADAQRDIRKALGLEN